MLLELAGKGPYPHPSTHTHLHVIAATMDLTEDEAMLSVFNLSRLGLLSTQSSTAEAGGGRLVRVGATEVIIDQFGRWFLRACTPPSGAQAGAQGAERGEESPG